MEVKTDDIINTKREGTSIDKTIDNICIFVQFII